MFGSSLRFLADLAIVTSVPVTARLIMQDRSRQTLRALQATNQGGRAARFEPRVQASEAGNSKKDLSATPQTLIVLLVGGETASGAKAL